VKLDTQGDYDTAVQILRLAEDVKGYREVRYPTMDAARAKVEALLGEKPKLDVTINSNVSTTKTVGV
jgi:hypothetical protein